MFAKLFSKLFLNASLRQKIRLVSWFASVLALVVAMGGYGLYAFEKQKEEALQNMRVVLQVIAQNLGDALYNIDAKTAGNILKSTAFDDSVHTSCAYDHDNALFASWHSAHEDKEANSFHTYSQNERTTHTFVSLFETCPKLLPFLPPTTAEDRRLKRIATQNTESNADGFELRLIGPNTVLGIAPITYGNKTYGILTQVFLLPVFLKEITPHISVIVMLFILAVAASLFLADRLQGAVSRPIIALAASMQRIAGEKNYSVRVSRQSRDEIGNLIDRFNEMLAEVEGRDRELLTSRINLENVVMQRTRELDKVRTEIQYSRDFLNQILDALPDPVLVKDGDLRYIAGNSRLWDLLPGGRESSQYKTDDDLFPKAEAERLYEQDARALMEGACEANICLSMPLGGKRVYNIKRARIVGLEKQSLLVIIMRELDSPAVRQESVHVYAETMQDEPAVLPVEAPLPISNLRILVVDDNPISQNVATDVFQNLGLKIKIAGSEDAARAMAGAEVFDALFVDGGLATHEREAFIGALRLAQARQDSASPKIIGLLSYKDSAENCRAAGMDDTLIKPLQISTLRGLLQKFFS